MKTLFILGLIIDQDKGKITEVFVLGQTLDNQLEYFKRKRAKEAFPAKELPFITKESFDEFNKRRKSIYQKFYDEVLSKLKAHEIVKIIKERLEELLMRYSKHIDNLAVLDHDGIVEMLGYRDKIKILSGALGYWLNLWDRRETTSPAEEVKWHKEYLERVNKLDGEYKEFAVVKKPEFFKSVLKEEAEKHLILEPDGTDRFNFWWWHL